MSKVVVADTKEKESIGEVVRTIVYALLIALLIRTVLVEPFNIPSGSMTTTLLTGDYVFVSKFSYGYSKHSLPFAPDFLHGRLFGSLPKRGDVAVFINPHTGDDYIKRIVGLPGDKIQVTSGVLIINGEPSKRVRLADYHVCDWDQTYDRPINEWRYHYTETMPGGVVHDILGNETAPRKFSSCIGLPPEPAPADSEPEDAYAVDNTAVFEVPEGHFFAMGDNRDNSADSRLDLGYVPVENLVGRADRRFISLEAGSHLWEFWRWPWTLRVSRFFGPIN